MERDRARSAPRPRPDALGRGPLSAGPRPRPTLLGRRERAPDLAPRGGGEGRVVPEGASREGGPAGEGAGPARMLMSWAAASLRTGAVAAGRAGAARQPSAAGPRLRRFPGPRGPPRRPRDWAAPLCGGCRVPPACAAAGSPCARGTRAAGGRAEPAARAVLRGQLRGRRSPRPAAGRAGHGPRGSGPDGGSEAAGPAGLPRA